MKQTTYQKFRQKLEQDTEKLEAYRAWRRAYDKKWRKNNVEYHKQHREQVKKWMREHPEEYRRRKHEYYLKYRDKNLKKAKEYRKKNKEKIDKADNKPQRKIGRRLRSRIINALVRQDAPKSKRIRELIGTTLPELKKYLEKKFKPGMSWENYGFYGWHIDHQTPLISFDLTKPEEQKKAFHYTNLQPLWAKENLSKKDKILN